VVQQKDGRVIDGTAEEVAEADARLLAESIAAHGADDPDETDGAQEEEERPPE
jgi:hypothetical protein